MFTAGEIQDVIDDYGTICEIIDKETAQSQDKKIVVRSISTGSINTRMDILSFADKSSLPRGADYGYALIMAGDAPENMRPEIKLVIIDNLGGVWTTEAAKPLYGIDKNSLKYVIAWRVLLRGKQRAVRGK
jgi:hypothetical protein